MAISALILSLTASGLQLATPREPLFGPNDVPPSALNRAGAVQFEALITPKGDTEWCRITERSSEPDLNRATCDTISRRHFRPAVGVDGVATYYLYRDTVDWNMTGLHADMTISLPEMPTGIDAPASVDVALEVDASGATTACVPAPSKPAEALGEFACEQTLKSWHPEIARTAKGVAVRSVQNVAVVFELAGHTAP